MMKKIKYSTLLITFLLSLVFTGCEKEKENVTVTAKNAEAAEKAEDSEYSNSEEASKSVEKRYLDTVLLKDLDSNDPLKDETLTEEQTAFTEFSTALSIGDKVVLLNDLPVWRNASSMDDNPYYIRKNSVVYLLNRIYDENDENKGMIEFIDDKGNTGWVSADFVQKAKTPEDSIIKKVWTKDSFDFACFSPNGEHIAFHRWDYLYSPYEGISVCDRVTGEELFTAYAQPDSRIACAYSPDGKYFYYLENDNTIYQLDTETQEKYGYTSFYNYNEDEYTTITGIYPLPDGDNVLAALYTGWGMVNKKNSTKMTVPSNDFMWANSFAFSPDGKRIAGSATNPADICVWDMEGNLCWSKYREYIGTLYFSEDSKTLYVVNETGITALDAETGEEKSKKRISLPYQMFIESFSINTKKDRVVFAVSERRGSDSELEVPYIYVYELSTGKFVQAERIEDNGKKIEMITLSPDGQYIAIRIDDGSYINECHQVICKIDLDKKARDLPVEQKSELKEKALGFLLDNTFDLNYWSLNFYYDGTYTISGRHDGTMTGRYELYEDPYSGGYFVKFTGCGYDNNEEEFEHSHEDLYGTEYVTRFPGTYRFDPDYVDFNICGAFTYTDDAEIAIPCSKQSPSGQEYDYFFAASGTYEKVYKYPGFGETGQALLYVNENTKMREEPFLDADEIYMSYYDYESGEYTESRCVLFADTTHRIAGVTVRKDTIDGITAPWYLVVEYNGEDGPDMQARLVWCFGGYSEVVYTDR